jgi:hypothetical protein
MDNPDLFVTLEFDIWWHKDKRVASTDMVEHTRLNKSFYKILEELN